MKNLPFALMVVICILVTASCTTLPTKSQAPARVDRYYKPLNTIQELFYDIQTKYDMRQWDMTIEQGNVFLSKYKRDILAVAVQYYMAVSYQQTGEDVKAEQLYKRILGTHPDDEWGKLATVGMQELEEIRALRS